MIGRAFRRSHPHVTLLTEQMWNARMLPALRSGEIDLALALCPEVDREFSYETIRQEQVVVLMASSHRLADRAGIELGAGRGPVSVLPAAARSPPLRLDGRPLPPRRLR